MIPCDDHHEAAALRLVEVDKKSGIALLIDLYVVSRIVTEAMPQDPIRPVVLVEQGVEDRQVVGCPYKIAVGRVRDDFDILTSVRIADQ